jgi:MoaA/NifB/PqqE/SkfB family radical SAM enzyme
MAGPVRTARVSTNLRCNLNCVYCGERAPTDDLAKIAPARVRAAIDDALATGARELYLTGGEPTLRRDLEALVAHARARGAERVTIETNATLIDDARAAALAAAGCSIARVNVCGVDPALDEVTRDPGGLARTLAGVRALAGAGIALEIACALTRSTRALVVDVPPRLVALVGARALRMIEAVVPVEAPDASELLTFEAAAETLLALDAAARAASVPLQLSREPGPPPCVFPPRARMQHLYSLTPGAAPKPRHRHVDACATCIVADRCSGLPDAYLARHAPPAMHPIREERARRRLSLVSTVPEQIARELVTRSLWARPDGTTGYDEIVRVNFHCNQSCTFCFVSTHLPPAADDVVADAIRAAGAHGSRIVLSGGEPTLNARIVEYVALAKSVSAQEVVLQTNAVRLDDAALVAALAAAGLDEAFVSLHGARAATSDAITEAPGTFARTLVGIDRLHETRVRVMLNFVICELNHGELPELVRMVAERWPRASLNVSFVAASTDVVPRDKRLIPRYTDALPPLGDAAREAARLGVKLWGFESMCGVPLCLLPDGVDRAQLALAEIPDGFDRGEFVKTDECRRCRYATTCYGLRRGYAELWGTDELRAQ